MRVVPLLTLVSCLLLGACGPPNPGDSCKNDLELTCFGYYSALECRGGTWTKIPCFGFYGCSKFTGRTLCDISGNRVGELCPSYLTGPVGCAGDGLVVCMDGMLVQMTCTNGCVVGSNGQFGCR